MNTPTYCKNCATTALVVTKAPVKKTFAKENRVIVEGVNKIKKHQKPSNMNPNGGIIDTEAPINASNVMLLDPSTNEPTRVGFEVVDGKKVRVAKKSGKQID